MSIYILMKIFIINIFDKFYDYQVSDARNKIDMSLMKQFTTSGKHQIETSIGVLNLSFCRKVTFIVKENQY